MVANRDTVLVTLTRDGDMAGNSVCTTFNISITGTGASGTVTTKTLAVILGISGIRSNDKIEREADVEAMGTDGDLTRAWSYTSATGSAAFSVNNEASLSMQVRLQAGSYRRRPDPKPTSRGGSAAPKAAHPQRAEPDVS